MERVDNNIYNNNVILCRIPCVNAPEVKDSSPISDAEV